MGWPYVFVAWLHKDMCFLGVASIVCDYGIVMFLFLVMFFTFSFQCMFASLSWSNDM